MFFFSRTILLLLLYNYFIYFTFSTFNWLYNFCKIVFLFSCFFVFLRSLKWKHTTLLYIWQLMLKMLLFIFVVFRSTCRCVHFFFYFSSPDAFRLFRDFIKHRNRAGVCLSIEVKIKWKILFFSIYLLFFFWSICIREYQCMLPVEICAVHERTKKKKLKIFCLLTKFCCHFKQCSSVFLIPFEMAFNLKIIEFC